MNTYLASRYQLFNGGFTEECISIRYNFFVGGNLFKVSIETCFLHVHHCDCHLHSLISWGSFDSNLLVLYHYQQASYKHWYTNKEVTIQILNLPDTERQCWSITNDLTWVIVIYFIWICQLGDSKLHTLFICMTCYMNLFILGLVCIWLAKKYANIAALFLTLNSCGCSYILYIDIK